MKLNHVRVLWGLLALVVLSRLLPMLAIPLADSTEARYAEIARMMLESGDWITPYFDYGVPFWGKPPLAFWAQALSFKLLGLNDFAPRLPSWLASLAMIGLLFVLLDKRVSRRAALWAMLIFSSCLLVYVLSGAVLTDPFLALSVSLSLVAFVQVRHQGADYWRYLFFVGLAIGLLSKGPLALVLIVGPIVLWLLFSSRRWSTLRLFPWWRGGALLAVLSLPWYIAAELKTPGFLNYFILGEHFYRFVDPGWAGDLYGSAHQKPHGSIWLLWIPASLPWGLIALWLIGRHLMSAPSRSVLWQTLRDDDVSLYAIWAVFPMVFFTLAGNVLWTYLLPALPALAILLALYFDAHQTAFFPRRIAIPLTALVPVLMLLVSVYVVQHPGAYKSEKYLVSRFSALAGSPEKSGLIFIAQRPYSARYYSRGKAQLLSLDALKGRLQSADGSVRYVAVPNELVSRTQRTLAAPMRSVYKNKRFELFEIRRSMHPQGAVPVRADWSAAQVCAGTC